jgi:hypothetical protein
MPSGLALDYTTIQPVRQGRGGDVVRIPGRRIELIKGVDGVDRDRAIAHAVQDPFQGFLGGLLGVGTGGGVMPVLEEHLSDPQVLSTFQEPPPCFSDPISQDYLRGHGPLGT